MSIGQWLRAGSEKESWVQLKLQGQQEVAAWADTLECCWDIFLTKFSDSFVKSGDRHFQAWHRASLVVRNSVLRISLDQKYGLKTRKHQAQKWHTQAAEMPLPWRPLRRQKQKGGPFCPGHFRGQFCIQGWGQERLLWGSKAAWSIPNILKIASWRVCLAPEGWKHSFHICSFLTFLVCLLKLHSGSKVNGDEDSNFWLLLAFFSLLLFLDEGLKKIKGRKYLPGSLGPTESFQLTVM